MQKPSVSIDLASTDSAQNFCGFCEHIWRLQKHFFHLKTFQRQKPELKVETFPLKVDSIFPATGTFPSTGCVSVWVTSVGK